MSVKLAGKVSDPALRAMVNQSPMAGYVLLFLEEFLSAGPMDQGFLRSLGFFHRFDRAPLIHVDDQEAAQSFQTEPASPSTTSGGPSTSSM